MSDSVDALFLRFRGEIIEWRGPAPFLFVRVPDAEAARIKAIARQVTYGWGVIPVLATIGDTEFETSLFPRDGGYLVPVKKMVQVAEEVDEGDEVAVHLQVGP
jgi:hypothetical protein